MSDALTRVCGLSELTSDQRQRLRAELEYVSDVFARVDRGAGFCEDRGFGWTAAMERAGGTDRVFESLRAWPILRRLLPRLRHFRHEKEPLFGVYALPHDDVIVAKLLLTNTRSFSGHFGEDWGQRSIQVRFEPDAIRVTEESLATTTGGQPLDSSESTADYTETRSGAFWMGLASKLDRDTWNRAAALASRMGTAVFPCDRCGRAARTLSIAGTVLTCAGPFAPPASYEVTPAEIAALREALAAQDMPAVRRINPLWAKGYHVADDANYCASHFIAESQVAPTASS